MDNLRNSIKLYFERLNPEEIFKRKNLEIVSIEREKSTFFSASQTLKSFDKRTNDELENIYRKVSEDWMFAPGRQYGNDSALSPFYLLTHFNEQVLKEVEAEPYVHFHHLLKWRDLTFRLGEDLFTTSFLAYRDIIARKERKYFSWRPVLFSDNRRLHAILQKGVAENHSHLWASSLTFDLNWLALMNHYPFFKGKVKEFQKDLSLSVKMTNQFHTEKVEFDVQLKKAIALRLILFKSLDFYEKGYNIQSYQTVSKNENQINSKITDLRTYLKLPEILNFDINHLFNPSNSIDSFDLLLNFQSIQDHINLIGQESGIKLPHNGNEKVVDYALSKNVSPQNFSGCYYLAGERNLLYRAFKTLYTKLESNQDIRIFEKLLHAYILFKNNFRKELIQLNERFGFGNFKNYQDRKMYFIEGKTLYTTIFLDISLNYNKELMNVISSEFRIGPKNSGKELKKLVEDIIRVRQYHESDYDWEKRLLGKSDSLNIIRQENLRSQGFIPNDIYFVLHFFKRKDFLFIKNDGKKKKLEITFSQQQKSRDFYLRETVKNHAKGIREFREQHPEFAHIIRGVDAASSEIDARPEAFAQAFRFLKNHQIRENYSEIKGKIINNRLNITFHAGEDFFDIIDGLRYLDECLFFLNMEHGDRFGHAIALGIDVSKYYELKQHKLVLSRHTLLDNIAWLLSKVRKFGLGKHVNEVYRLESIFKSLFSEIYLNSCDKSKFQHIHYQQYFDAWKLRGDNPEIYYNFFSENKQGFSKRSIGDYFENIKNITYWDRCGINSHYSQLSNIRKREEIAQLYFEYHYNPTVKNKGNEMKQFEITSEYIQLVEDIQKQMMNFISRKNISIETNPTSNFLIGPIEKYIDHPIIKWYNLGLEVDTEKIKESPQLSVSINTDDAGIFSTSLENEYALMAIALEKEKDGLGNPKYKSAMIYDWLDRIREMGLQQSFLHKKDL